MPDKERVINEAIRDRYRFPTFAIQLDRIPPRVWAQLGEARSKCDHLAGVPLTPKTADDLHRIYMVKGVLATSAIEGNTLSEAQVNDILEDKLQLPESQQYLQQEVKNIADACGKIFAQLRDGGETRITADLVCGFHAQTLRGLNVESHVAPGRFRTTDVTVARYRPPDWQLVEPLVIRLCDWLNGREFSERNMRVELQILRAILAHLYVAWIHPFGDGNGRTARLLEFHLLIAAGVPTPAAHLLSNHYNETRTEYYRQLDHASRSGGDVVPFITYAVQGFVDGLAEQLTRVRDQQIGVTWESFVFSRFDGKRTATDRRRRDLVRAIGSAGVPLTQIRRLNPELAVAYAKKSDRTVMRDILALEAEGLVFRDGGLVHANVKLVEAFLPRRRIEPPSDAE